MPVECLGQEAAGEKPDRRARCRDEAVDADRACPLARLVEHRHDHAEDDRRGHGASDALYEPYRDQHLLADGQTAQQGGSREHRYTRKEDPPPTKEVAESSRQDRTPPKATR